MKVESKKVLIIEGLKTEEEFTNYVETTPVIALWNDKLICWYEKRNGNKLNEIRGKVLSCKRTFIIERDNNKAVYSLDGEVIIPFYDYDSIVEHPYAIEVEKDGMKAAYSYKGKQILPCIYYSISFRKDDIFVETHYGYKGIYSYLGDKIIPAKFKNIKRYHNSYVVVTYKNGDIYSGLYSADGKKILSARYDNYYVTSPYIYLSLNGLTCVYDLITGKRILPLKFKDISVYYNVFVTEEADKKFSIYSAENGKKLTDEFYDNIKIYDQGILLLETVYGKKMFYLTEHNAFVNGNTNDVYYNKVDKRVYIKETPLNQDEGDVYKPYIKEC